MAEYLENRRHFRLKQHFDVLWSLPGSIHSGFATVLNISQSGLQLVTDHIFPMTDAAEMTLQPMDGLEKPFFSRKAKVVWFKRVEGSSPRYQCGVAFGVGEGDQGLSQWMKNRVQELGEGTNTNIIQNYVT